MSDKVPGSGGPSDDRESPNAKVWPFVGERHRPLLPEELAQRRPVTGTGAPADELLALRRRHIIFVAGASDEEPGVVVSRIRRDGHEGYPDGWRIDVSLHEGQSSVMPKVHAVRQSPGIYRAGIKPDAGYSGYRPEWVDMLYLPRVIPKHGKQLMRRINGRKSRPLTFENRHLLHDTSYPWGCIGRVSSHNGNGSGVLVGKNIVVTAAHVVPWGDHSAMSFDTGHVSEPGVAANVVEARGYDTVLTGYDWAILKLDKPLGDMVGYMGYNHYTDDWEDRPYWTIVGYPEGIGPFWQGGISIHDDDEDDNGGQEFESQDADTIEGDSGGPMFAWWNSDPRIIGVVSGLASEHVPIAYEENHIIAGGPGLGHLIAWGRSNW